VWGTYYSPENVEVELLDELQDGERSAARFTDRARILAPGIRYARNDTSFTALATSSASSMNGKGGLAVQLADAALDSLLAHDDPSSAAEVCSVPARRGRCSPAASGCRRACQVEATPQRRVVAEQSPIPRVGL
jgi:hypothetical protein